MPKTMEALLRRGEPPVLLKLRSSAGLIVTMTSFAVFTDVFLYAVIVPVIPFSLSRQVGVPEDQVQYWVSISLAVYGAALLVASPTWGYLADRIRNRKVPMLCGLVLLGASTAFLCAARNLAMLLVGRALQGICAALTWTVGLALVVDTVDTKHVGMAMGWIGMATSLGILTAPLLGGVVYGKGGYYAVFAMCFGLIAVDIALRLAIIEIKEAKKWLEPDFQGQTSQRQATSVMAQEKPPVQGETAPSGPAIETDQTPRSLEAQRPAPTSAEAKEKPHLSGLASMVGLLRKPRLLAALWGTLVHSLVQTSFDSTLPLIVESLWHWDSIGAGLIFLPLVLPTFLSPWIGTLGDRYGPKWLTTCGFLIATPFLICMRFVEENSIEHKVLLCALLVGIGVAIALVFGPLMAEITWSVLGDENEETENETGPDADDSPAPYAQAYGFYNMAFSGGAMLGPIMGGMIRDAAGIGAVGWSLAVVTVVTAVTQALWIGKPMTWPRLGRS